MQGAELINHIRGELRQEWLAENEQAWCIGYSAGKDSTALLQLCVEAILASGEVSRRTLVITMSDTLVENPVMGDRMMSSWKQLQEQLPKVIPGVVFDLSRPDPDQTFWVLLLGRGYPAPTRNLRWCTDRLKIRPRAGLRNRFPNIAFLSGRRADESSARNQSLSRERERSAYQESTRFLVRPDGDIVWSPIQELSTEDLWAFLLQNPPPWGGSHRDLITIYKNAGGECPVVFSKDDAPGCGTSSARFGCWTCTVVQKDRSLKALSSGREDLEALIDFRERLREVSTDMSYRATRRRNGQPGNGPLSLTTRKMLLQELLEVQRESGRSLISPDEISRIHKIWELDGERTPLLEEELPEALPARFFALPVMQGDTEQWLISCTVGQLLRISALPKDKATLEERYQRDISWVRVQEISRYVLDTSGWVLPPITICASVGAVEEDSGTLLIKQSCAVVDGQHRRAALELAAEYDRSILDSQIGVQIRCVSGVAEMRQLFADLNSGKPIPKALTLFMDARKHSDVLDLAEKYPFRGLIDPVHTAPSGRSRYLWGLPVLTQIAPGMDLLWVQQTLERIPEFKRLLEGKLSAGQCRAKYVWAHSVGLRVLVGLKSWDPDLVAALDWERSANIWQGGIVRNNKMDPLGYTASLSRAEAALLATII